MEREILGKVIRNNVCPIANRVVLIGIVASKTNSYPKEVQAALVRELVTNRLMITERGQLYNPNQPGLPGIYVRGEY